MLPDLIHVDDLTADQRLLLKRGARLEWAEACAADGDILGWGQATMPDKFSLPYCMELHQYIVDIRRDEMTATEAPRNHAKTAIGCTLIPLFQAIYEPDAYHHYLNVQSTSSKADLVNLSIKSEFETNDFIKELTGDHVGNEKWTDHQFVTKEGIVFTALGAGQSIRGLQYKNERPDFFNIDDLYDDAHIENVPATLRLNAWFWSSLYPARAKSRKCAIHITGTAINNYDLLEKAKTMPDVMHRTFAAIKDFDNKIVLWPELNTWDSLQKDWGRMESTIFFREMQNERRDESTAIVKRGWLYPVDGSPSWEYDPAELLFDKQHALAAVMILCDPSIGQKLQNDYTAVILMLIARESDGNGNVFYIHDAWNEHLTMDKRIKLLQDIATSQPRERTVTEVRIEAIAGFKDFAAEAKRRTNLPIKDVDVVKDKIANLDSKSRFFENRKVRINRRLGEKMTKEGISLKDLITYQLTTNYPKHDDLRDAILLGLDSVSGLWNFV